MSRPPGPRRTSRVCGAPAARIRAGRAGPRSEALGDSTGVVRVEQARNRQARPVQGVVAIWRCTGARDSGQAEAPGSTAVGSTVSGPVPSLGPGCWPRSRGGALPGRQEAFGAPAVACRPTSSSAGADQKLRRLALLRKAPPRRRRCVLSEYGALLPGRHALLSAGVRTPLARPSAPRAARTQSRAFGRRTLVRHLRWRKGAGVLRQLRLHAEEPLLVTGELSGRCTDLMAGLLPSSGRTGGFSVQVVIDPVCSQPRYAWMTSQRGGYDWHRQPRRASQGGSRAADGR